MVGENTKTRRKEGLGGSDGGVVGNCSSRKGTNCLCQSERLIHRAEICCNHEGKLYRDIILIVASHAELEAKAILGATDGGLGSFEDED